MWRDEEFGEMRLRCMAGTANELGGLSFNDWQPVDADTWTVLEKMKQRRRR